MMDKIVVTAADIEKLLAWRDEHNDLVRSMPVPLREVEIRLSRAASLSSASALTRS